MDGLAFLAGILVICVMLVISADVALRFLMDRPIPWVLEATEYSLLYITFLGTAWLLKREGHVKLDFVLDRLEPRTASILNVITSILMTIVCLLLAWYGAQSTWDHFERGVRSVKYFSLPMFAFLAIIPVGSFFLVVQSLKRTYCYLLVIKKKKDN